MMAELSISALLIRFVLGGAAVVLATIVAKIVGQKAGGIFAVCITNRLAGALSSHQGCHCRYGYKYHHGGWLASLQVQKMRQM